MALRISHDRLFEWLKTRDERYVVLRDLEKIHRALQGGHRVSDIDLLIDDELVEPLRMFAKHIRGKTKLDLYSLTGQHGCGYHGFPHLPIELGERVLDNRPQLDYFTAPSEADELDALLYHVAYHKSVQSDIHSHESALSQNTTDTQRIIELNAKLDYQSLEINLLAFHNHLAAKGLAVTEDRLIRYIQHDFRYARKSYFHAYLQDQHVGEMNLFVIRATAVKRGFAEAFMQKLRMRYDIVKAKPIDWKTRWRTRKAMRGGKWRRGGLPHIAVVVYDKQPLASTAEQRQVHPFVFNQNQFAKVQWREWFTTTSGAPSNDNPIHSTDNEAEAFGHLPLFFSADEQAEILSTVRLKRSQHNTDAG